MPNYLVDVTDYSGYKEKEMNIMELMLYYATEIDHVEYPDFDSWKADMTRCGIMTERR